MSQTLNVLSIDFDYFQTVGILEDELNHLKI